MTVTFVYRTGRVSYPKDVKTTLIEYINAGGVDEAFVKASERKHEIIVELAKGEAKLLKEKAWGERSQNIQISLDAVVAKPDITIKQIVSKLKILSFVVDKSKDRIECHLPNGLNLMLSKPALETLLESFDSESVRLDGRRMF